MVGFGMARSQAKALFFDRPAVMNAVDRAKRRGFVRFGGRVRTTARRSIRPRKGVAPEGSPPSSHTKLLRDGIFFVYEPTQSGVIIGPVRLNQKVGNAPEALEKGGPSHQLIRRRGKLVRVKIDVSKHPYMQPAFDEAISRQDELWKNSVK